MTGYAIIVDFRLRPGTQAAFRKLVDENARTSARTEKGCRRFDVLEPSGEDDRVLLVEVYDDEPAFHAHVETGHYRRFDVESAPMVSEKSVIRCNLVVAPK